MMYRNQEGYPDPVVGAVMAKLLWEAKHQAQIKRIGELYTQPLVYIASPLRGCVEYNKSQARKYCRFAIEQGKNPLASHLIYTQFLKDHIPEERETGRVLGLALLAYCSEVWVFGQYISEGMRAEILLAKKLGKPIRYFTEEMEELYENA